jgi:hypothetical protein
MVFFEEATPLTCSRFMDESEEMHAASAVEEESGTLVGLVHSLRPLRSVRQGSPEPRPTTWRTTASLHVCGAA